MDHADDRQTDMVMNASGESRARAARDLATEILSDDGVEDDEVIGLFGASKKNAGARYNLTKAGRRARLNEIFSIARKYDVVHGVTPVKLRCMLEELGPTFVKAGQILSMRSEILPERFCQELAKLRADVEPMPYDAVLLTLQSEYARPLDTIFSSIDETPLGSASVAQVHRARLVTGQDVAVKVQRPHVQEVMAQDIDIMRSIAKNLSRFVKGDQFLNLQSVVEELWESFREETDFLIEARNLQEFKENNAGCVFVDCPSPYMSYCTEHVVVMDYVRGITIAKPADLVDAGYDLTEIGTKLVDNYASQVLDDGFFHADPHPGNIIVSGGRIVFIDLGIMGRLSARYRGIMRDIMFAVAERDTPKLKDGLLRFSLNKDVSDIDHAQLLADIDLIVDNYGTTNLEDLDLGEFLNSIISLARRHGIELPSTVTMIARGMVTLEGVLDEFLPGVSMIQIISDHVRSSGHVELLVEKEAKDLALESRAAAHGVLKAASQADLVTTMLTRGQLKFNMDFVGSEDPIDDLSHIADRLTMGVMIAGLYIGSSVVYYARIQPVIFGIPVLGFVGYVIAVVLSVDIVSDILRRNHKRKR